MPIVFVIASVHVHCIHAAKLAQQAFVTLSFAAVLSLKFSNYTPQYSTLNSYSTSINYRVKFGEV